MALPASGEQTLNLSSFVGQKLVVYFYPKDSTPGCTTEGQAFRDMYPQFQAANCAVIGVSKDSVKSHDNFIAKQNFPFPLIADTEGKLCEAFGVWVQKNMYGRQYMGIERSTFLFDEQGVLAQAWKKVKVKGHVETVLTAAQD